MTEKLDYTKSLNSLKNTFLGGSERNIWIKAISDHFPQKRLRFLDIGTGDGKSLEKTINHLHYQRRYEIELAAIDPLLDGLKRVSATFPSAKIVHSTFENYESDLRFDIVNATQSVYYIINKLQALQKMIQYTQSRGLIIITLCSRECILSKLHYDVMGLNSDLWVNAEDIYELLKKQNGIENVQIEFFQGEVDLTSWKTSREILEMAYEIIARGGLSTVSKLDSFAQALCNYKDIETRINGIIIGQRTA